MQFTTALFPPVAALMLTAAFIVQPLSAENWPQWRGLNNDGISHETNIPVQALKCVRQPAAAGGEYRPEQQ